MSSELTLTAVTAARGPLREASELFTSAATSNISSEDFAHQLTHEMMWRITDRSDEEAHEIGLGGNESLKTASDDAIVVAQDLMTAVRSSGGMGLSIAEALSQVDDGILRPSARTAMMQHVLTIASGAAAATGTA